MPAGRKDKEPDPKGLYSTLGISLTADDNEIRKAYRRLALRWHPDKNPDDASATEQFQRISSAYEVLSDPRKREMYDSTGCIDEEELMEGQGSADFAAEIFAAFFGGGMQEDLDEDEQTMMDEFLRLAGSNPFKMGRGRRRGRKGRSGRGSAKKGARASEEEMFGEAMMAMMAGGMPGMPGMGGMGFEPQAPVCPQGHNLKRRKADADYECDVCGKDIATGKRLFDCRKCDWSMCQRCCKEAEAALEEDDGPELLDQAEILEAFCEMHTKVVRQGKRLQHKCEICEAMLGSEDKVLPHMEENHIDVIEAFLEEAMIGGAGGDPFGGLGGGRDPFGGLGGGLGGLSPEDLLMGMMGGMGGPPGRPGMSSQGYPGSSGSGRQSGSRKKK